MYKKTKVAGIITLTGNVAQGLAAVALLLLGIALLSGANGFFATFIGIETVNSAESFLNGLLSGALGVVTWLLAVACFVGTAIFAPGALIMGAKSLRMIKIGGKGSSFGDKKIRKTLVSYVVFRFLAFLAFAAIAVSAVSGEDKSIEAACAFAGLAAVALLTIVLVISDLAKNRSAQG